MHNFELHYTSARKYIQHMTLLHMLRLKVANILFQELPHEYVPPNMLQKVAMHGDINKCYATEIRRQNFLHI